VLGGVIEWKRRRSKASDAKNDKTGKMPTEGEHTRGERTSALLMSPSAQKIHGPVLEESNNETGDIGNEANEIDSERDTHHD
jgi:hypothetical protein